MKTEAERQLAKLVSMPTITDDITANALALDYLEAYLAKRGMHTRRDHFNGHSTLLASTRPGNLLTPTVLLTGHIDVVPGEEQLFTLREAGDKLIGRGVYDMKFALAGYLQAVDDLQENLDEYDFGIAIVSDEETSDDGTRCLVEAGLRPKVALLPDSTAPGWDIEKLAKGFWRVDLIAQGRTAHGGRPWEGESASLKLIQALHELKSHFEGQNPSSDSLNIGKIHGGETYNVVPSEMIAGLDIRYLSYRNLEEKRKLLRTICRKHDLTFKELVCGDPVITELKHPLVESYAQSVGAVTGQRPNPFTSSAGTDAPYFARQGINAIISCCQGGGHHTAEEWISHKSFLQFVPILHHYLNKTAKVPAAKEVDTVATLL